MTLAGAQWPSSAAGTASRRPVRPRQGSTHITTGGGSGNASYGETAEKWGLWGGLPQQQPTEKQPIINREQIVSDSARGLSAGKSLALSGGTIGKGGAMLKKIATAAREELEAFLNCKVNLQCWVKVKEDWRNEERMLRNFGFTEER